MRRQKIYTVPYTMLLTPKQHDHLEKKYGHGRMAANIRGTIDEDILMSGAKLPQLRKELELLEPKLLNLRREIKEEEIKEKEDNEKISIKEIRIAQAHKNLLDSLKRAYWKPAGIQKSAYRLYAEFTGLSVKELMDWVQEQANRRYEIEDSETVEIKEHKVPAPEKIINETPEEIRNEKEELAAAHPKENIDENTKEKRIAQAHENLLDSLKRAYWNPEGIQKAAYKIYAEFTGLSVKELMDWVQEQANRRYEIE